MAPLTISSGDCPNLILCSAVNPLPTDTRTPLCSIQILAIASYSPKTPSTLSRMRELSVPTTVYSASSHCLNFRISFLTKGQH